MFQRSRHLEHHTNNKELNNARVWHNLLETQVLDKVHAFKPPNVAALCEPKGADGQLNPKVFTAPMRGPPEKLTEIVKKKSTWYSPGPAHFGQIFAEKHLLHQAWKRQMWEEIAASAQWCVLMRTTSMLVRKHGTTTWNFTLRDVSGLCALGWPARQSKQVGPVKAYSPDTSASAKASWMVVTNPVDWDAMMFSWVGPLETQFRSYVGVQRPSTNSELVAVPKSEPKSLLETVARECFFDLPASTIKWMCTARSCEVDGSTEFNLLSSLIQNVCPAMNDPELLEVLSKRLEVVDEYHEYLELPGLEESMHEGDAKEFDQERTTAKRRQLGQQEFKEAYFAKARSSIVGKGPKVKKQKFPSDGVAKKDAQQYAPPGWTIYSDERNGRWQVFGEGRTVSRSWNLYGFESACKRALAGAWSHHLLLRGLGTDKCPFEGLFQGSEQSGSSASG